MDYLDRNQNSPKGRFSGEIVRVHGPFHAEVRYQNGHAAPSIAHTDQHTIGRVEMRVGVKVTVLETALRPKIGGERVVRIEPGK